MKESSPPLSLLSSLECLRRGVAELKILVEQQLPDPRYSWVVQRHDFDQVYGELYNCTVEFEQDLADIKRRLQRQPVADYETW